MDASRLLSVLADITEEYTTGLKALLAALLTAYTTARDAPTQDHTPQIDAAFEKLAQFLRASATNAYPPTYARILTAIGAVPFAGAGALETVTHILATSQRTPAGAVTALTTYSQDAATFLKGCTQASSGLSLLGLTPHRVSPGEFEVGLAIPESLTDSHLSELIKQLSAWNKTLRGIAEVAGEEDREVTVKGLGTGSHEAYLAVGILTATLLGKIIDRVLDWYTRVLDIQRKRKELAALGAPVAEGKAVEEFERKYIEDSISSLAKELVAGTHAKLNAERRGELENHLTISIRQVVKFVDRGGDVEVTTGIPETPPAPTEPGPEASESEKADYTSAKSAADLIERQREDAVRLSADGAKLRQLPSRSQPILQLGDSTTGASAPSGEHETEEKRPRRKP